MKISEIMHPEYEALFSEWQKWRLTFEGGRDFIKEYLERYSIREDAYDFSLREDITYCPAHAKAAIIDIRNAIFQRLTDISRIGGSVKYQKACQGEDSGIDLLGNSMSSFIGRIILPELLTIAKVGIYIDMPELTGKTLKDQYDKRPFLYIYKAEDIRSWTYDNNIKVLTSILLRDWSYSYDKKTNLPTDYIEKFRYLRLDKDGVHVTFYNSDGQQIDKENNLSDVEYILNLNEIPIVIAELSNSLMSDVADHQIALLNISSSDLMYILKANFPFYTEQYDTRLSDGYMRPNNLDTDGSDLKDSVESEITTGISQGRRYPKGLERPGFINPSSEPLKASMGKQEQIKKEIRQLVNLSLANINPKMASEKSKEYDERTLEAGLSYIGLELEHTERRIAEIWHKYEGLKNQVIITYPKKYSLKKDAEKLEEIETLRKLVNTVPSIKFQKEATKLLIEDLIGSKISLESLNKIKGEIEKSVIPNIEHKNILEDVEKGILSVETASKILGYPIDESKKAQKEHAERLKRLMISQTKGAARGLEDMDINKDSAKEEKELSQNSDLNNSLEKKVRGETHD